MATKGRGHAERRREHLASLRRALKDVRSRRIFELGRADLVRLSVKTSGARGKPRG